MKCYRLMVFQQLPSHCRSVWSLMCDCPLRIREFSFPVATRSPSCLLWRQDFHRVEGMCKLKTRTHMGKLAPTIQMSPPHLSLWRQDFHLVGEVQVGKLAPTWKNLQPRVENVHPQEAANTTGSRLIAGRYR